MLFSLLNNMPRLGNDYIILLNYYFVKRTISALFFFLTLFLVDFYFSYFFSFYYIISD